MPWVHCAFGIVSYTNTMRSNRNTLGNRIPLLKHHHHHTPIYLAAASWPQLLELGTEDRIVQKTEAKISLFRMIYCCTGNPRYDSGRIIALPPDEVRKLIVCINRQHVRTCEIVCIC